MSSCMFLCSAWLMLMAYLVQPGEGQTSTIPQQSSSTDYLMYYMVHHRCHIFRDSPDCKTTTEESDWCRVSVWGPWSNCTVFCAPLGERSRTRECRTDTCDSGECEPGSLIETQKCSMTSIPCCKGFPHWAEWGRWGALCGSKRCGLMEQSRQRSCIQCTYFKQCQNLTGSTTQTKKCPNPCPPECIKKRSWFPWLRWSVCRASCDSTGIQVRTRTCRSKLCTDGSPCLGEWQEKRICTALSCCKENPKWAIWSEWSNCTDECNTVGMQSRKRGCYYLDECPPSSFCKGLFEERRHCFKKEAPKWGEWTMWSECTESCGPGTQQRSRKCGGTNKCVSCLGEKKEKRTCFTWCCEDVKVGSWSSWTRCRKLCKGRQTRKRTCEAKGCELEKAQCDTMGREIQLCKNRIPSICI